MFLRFSLRLALLAALSAPAWTQDGSVDPDFRPNLRQPGSVDFIKVEPGGIILLGGQFKFVNGTAANGVARINASGTVTQIPQIAAAPGMLRVLDRFSDGGLLVAERLSATSLGARIRRLQLDGTPIAGFTEINVLVDRVAALVLPDDRFILSAVPFLGEDALHGLSDSASLLRRYQANGVEDTSFPISRATTSIGTAAFIPRLIGLADGRFYSAGSYRQVVGSSAVERSRIVRFMADGSIDQDFTFTPAVPEETLAAQQPDGRLLAITRATGSEFGYVLRRLSATGQLDAAPFQGPLMFSPRAFGVQVTPLDDGRTLLARRESDYTLEALLADGSVDPAYQPAVTGSDRIGQDLPFTQTGGVKALTAVSSGRALLGGSFQRAGGENAISIALLAADGRAAAGFNPGTGAEFAATNVLNVAVDLQDRIVVLGAYSSIDGVTSPGLARLQPDGSVDLTFRAALPAGFSPERLRVLTDGSMVLAPYAGYPIRLNAQGAVDPNFVATGAILPTVPEAGLPLIRGLHVPANRSVYLAGAFLPNRAAGPGRYGLARLLGQTGALDEGFNAGLGAELPGVTSFFAGSAVVAGDNSVVFWGGYDAFSGDNGRIARVLAFDATGVFLTAYQPALPFLEAGVFLPIPGGDLLVGSGFPPSAFFNARERTALRGPQLARLKADGSVDPTFNAPASVEDSRGLQSLARQSDGRIFQSGYFRILGGRKRHGVARLQTNGALDDSFDPGNGPTLATGLNGQGIVGQIALQSTGAVVVSGSFDAFSGAARTGLVRLRNQSAPAASVPRGRLINVSSRAHVGAGENVTIAGFVLEGTGTRRVVVRAIGPSLAAFGLGGLLPNPRLRLVNAGGSEVASNDNWRDGDVAGLAEFDLQPTNDAESAIVANLPAGAYTALVDDPSGAQGNIVVEVYDLAADGAARVVNLSTRAAAHPVSDPFPQIPGGISTRPSALIGGFVIRGGPCRVLIRSLGVSLGAFGIVQPSGQVNLQLRSPDTSLLARNNNAWQLQDAPADAAAITASGFAPGDSLESALVVELPEGSYTAVLDPGQITVGGVGTVEIYELPAP